MRHLHRITIQKIIEGLALIILCMALAWVVILISGCAAIPDAIDNTMGSANQKTESGPLYKYRADLKLSFTEGGKEYNGTTATMLNGPMSIRIKSLINIDRVQITTCSRQDVCEKDGDCPSAMDISGGWFGSAGRTAVYSFTPSKKELEGYACPMYIEVFSGNSLVSWGLIGFRTDESLPAHVSCNGQPWTFSGVTVCQSKGGLDQQMSFDQDVTNFKAEASCHATQVDARNFNFRPENGFCRATFYDGKNWHRAVFIGYQQVLVRGGG